MVSTGASLDKSMAYQKLIVTVVTRHVKDTPSHSGSQTGCRIFQTSPATHSKFWRASWAQEKSRYHLLGSTESESRTHCYRFPIGKDAGCFHVAILSRRCGRRNDEMRVWTHQAAHVSRVQLGLFKIMVPQNCPYATLSRVFRAAESGQGIMIMFCAYFA